MDVVAAADAVAESTTLLTGAFGGTGAGRDLAGTRKLFRDATPRFKSDSMPSLTCLCIYTNLHN